MFALLTAYQEDLLWTFGCGGAGLLISTFMMKAHKLMACGFAIFSLTGIGFGITTVLAKRGYLDPDGMARLSPAFGLVLALIVMYAAFRRILKESDNAELRKLSAKMTIAFVVTMAGLFIFLALLIYGS